MSRRVSGERSISWQRSAELVEVLVAGVLGFLTLHLAGALLRLDVVIEVLDDRLGIFVIQEPALEGAVEDLAHGAEVLADVVDLVDDVGDEAQVGVVFAGEVEDVDVAGLAVAVEAAVALLEPGRIPGNLVVQDIAGRLLQVETLGGSVGGDEHANRTRQGR